DRSDYRSQARFGKAPGTEPPTHATVPGNQGVQQVLLLHAQGRLQTDDRLAGAVPGVVRGAFGPGVVAV
ncbi:MAG: hypothetical protein AVDCRST_MAG56-6499, partial [uncultured Cytophagales bacterium]